MPVRLIANLENNRIAIDLKDGVYRIGREKPADVVIPNATISGRHAELQVDGEKVSIRDLGSTNGTFVNGERIRAVTSIGGRDQLLLGSVPVSFEHPAPERAAPAQPILAGPTVKMEAAKAVVASKLSWPMRYWIAGAEAIVVLIAIYLFVQVYNNNTANDQRVRSKYRMFAEQYVHVLANPAMRPIPAPRLDDALTEPIFVTDASGAQLFPTPDADPSVMKPTPLIDPKTKRVYENAKDGYFAIPGTSDGDTSAMSYPVRAGGDLLGYVIARPAPQAMTAFGPLALVTLLGGLTSLLILALTLRRVHNVQRAQVAALQSKISPLANGFITELPRSSIFPEINDVASEIEAAVRTARAASPAARASKGGAAAEYAPFVADLVDQAGIPYCFIDGDYKIVSMSNLLTHLSEFARASVGVSIFDGGLNSLQAKMLVQALADARREGKARVKLELVRDGNGAEYAITARAQKRPGTDALLIGLIFEPVA